MRRRYANPKYLKNVLPNHDQRSETQNYQGRTEYDFKLISVLFGKIV